MILIDFQHSQKAGFSFEESSNLQNHSSSGSLHPVKKSPTSGISDSPPPLTAIWKTLISKTLWPLFVDEIQRLQRATMRRQFTFYQNFLVLIKSISEGWKFEMTLKPSSGFTKDRLKSQYVKLTQLWALTVNCRPNHYTIEISVLRLEMQFYNIFTNVLYIISLNFKDLWTTYHLWIYQVYMSQLHLASELYWKCTLGGKGLFRH